MPRKPKPPEPIVRHRPVKRYSLAPLTLDRITTIREARPELSSDSRVIDWAIGLALSSLKSPQ